MKTNIITLGIVTVILSSSSAVYAVTTSPTPTKKVTTTVTPTEEVEEKKASPSAAVANTDVKKLREKVAAKVSELKKKNHKPFAGEITTLSENTLQVTNADGVEMEVKIDDTITTLYQIAGNSTKEIQKDDLEKGDYIIVTGPLLDKTITANLIYVDESFIVGSGKIIEVDSESFFIKVVGQDKTTYTIDIERTTKQDLLDIKTLETTKIGFTKLKEGDLVHYVAEKPTKKDSTRFTGMKLVVVPQEYFNK